VEPFRINTPDVILDDLKERVRRRRLPAPLPDAGWSYGIDLAYLEELSRYWESGYDWRRTESLLNRFQQYRTEIDGTQVHFIHERSDGADALPLLLLHGWPSSIYEFHRVIKPLTTPARPSTTGFHVVCPSLPGYGWSPPPKESGWDIRRMARAFTELMARLGYDRFAVQGGDWGALIATEMGRAAPQHILGLHLSMVLVRPPTGSDVALTDTERQDLEAESRFLAQEMAYDEIQSTKPDTLAAALTDSPVGLAGWIVEKLRSWSDCQGEIERRFSKDEILDMVTIYWVTATAASSIRLYREYSRMQPRFGTDGRVEVPTACALFPADLYHPPRAWVEQRYDLRRWTVMPKGGHFAAFEEPELLVEDVRSFFGALWTQEADT